MAVDERLLRKRIKPAPRQLHMLRRLWPNVHERLTVVKLRLNAFLINYATRVPHATCCKRGASICSRQTSVTTHDRHKNADVGRGGRKNAARNFQICKTLKIPKTQEDLLDALEENSGFQEYFL